MEYKGYVNDILNTLISKDDILHRIEKENITEHSKQIKSLENQIEDLKKENQVLKEILTSKLNINENNIANNNIDDTWKTVKANRSNNVNNKVNNNRKFNSLDVSNKYQPIFIHENEVTEPYINNRMNNDVDEYKNAFNNNIDNNVTVHKRSPALVINLLVFLNKVKYYPKIYQVQQSSSFWSESICVRYKYGKGHKKK